MPPPEPGAPADLPPEGWAGEGVPEDEGMPEDEGVPEGDAPLGEAGVWEDEDGTPLPPVPFPFDPRFRPDCLPLELVEQTQEDFSPTGILSAARGFEYRPEQQEMAQAVAEALTADAPLLVEAGTGVGKSLAYLIPALRFALDNDRKAVISTHTINPVSYTHLRAHET